MVSALDFPSEFRRVVVLKLVSPSGRAISLDKRLHSIRSLPASLHPCVAIDTSKPLEKHKNMPRVNLRLTSRGSHPWGIVLPLIVLSLCS